MPFGKRSGLFLSRVVLWLEVNRIPLRRGKASSFLRNWTDAAWYSRRSLLCLLLVPRRRQLVLHFRRFAIFRFAIFRSRSTAGTAILFHRQHFAAAPPARQCVRTRAWVFARAAGRLRSERREVRFQLLNGLKHN